MINDPTGGCMTRCHPAQCGMPSQPNWDANYIRGLFNDFH
jgi:hypothetical protein